MIEKLIDAAIPFYPENQTHLQAPGKQATRRQLELYGPVLIYVTMIIEFLIVGHYQKLVTQEDFSQVSRRFGFLDAEAISAN